jgi:hypothetical protein
MDKSNLELFKQAISEGLSEKFDSIVDNCTEEIVCSDRHKLAMRTIIYGKADTKKALSPKMKRIIAIIVAAALLLTSCGIIFRNEIREVFEEFFVKLTYSGDVTSGNIIEQIYELTYLPEGYNLTYKNVRPLRIKWEYTNETNDMIQFEQHITGGSEFAVDSESGYSQIKEIKEYDVYYRFTEEYHNYIWSNNKYTFHLTSDQKLSNEEIELIIKGMT